MRFLLIFSCKNFAGLKKSSNFALVFGSRFVGVVIN